MVNENSNGSEWTMYSLLMKLTAEPTGKIEILKSISKSIDMLDRSVNVDSEHAYQSVIGDLNKALAHDNAEVRALAADAIARFTSFREVVCVSTCKSNDILIRDAPESLTFTVIHPEVDRANAGVVQSVLSDSQMVDGALPGDPKGVPAPSLDDEGQISLESEDGPHARVKCIVAVGKKERVCDDCGCTIHTGEMAYIRYHQVSPAVLCIPCYEQRYEAWSSRRQMDQKKARVLELLRNGAKTAPELREGVGLGYCTYIRRLMMDGYPIIKTGRTGISSNSSTVTYRLEQIVPAHVNPEYQITDDHLDRMLTTMRRGIAVELTKQVFKLHGFQIEDVELPDVEEISFEETVPDYLVSRDGSVWNKFLVRCETEDALNKDGFEMSGLDPTMYVINVSRKAVKCVTVKELGEGEGINPFSYNHLGDRDELKLNREMTITLCEYMCRFVHGAGY